ncbi:bifunctional phosphoribosyl-AMP cyclohydrolase/phosphoribosyl-ATP diphosphatase HisIE [Aquifex aeolicus]|uniref:Histidine biosynthesis bifunctional protein HisIE n=1 Tax=Aquifex aeolicus (strain VF5) TaxID=224324 RepID=HIS2_AQUAE|nr:bifunctional phosphoribosyl-AMP cyclohydrolase/phosphoribosyl-ATP diphosphatase HisIE [Aquifex aeolicus]O67780.1 RecName: Full=Histidine biosynthesis bifunctional protein HisIE; Includes: RecName: Full=Phosphoribosyl-AMP cyclohydrolase; Short=PRA-CH; Includes: RecName: Full=Phosphoribosyl-ATP pyrophosphatase; Short=PRA-PH [Aquifex aeolicus VF5]AAC07730.1 phosphoribosyl-ATP pyrophosphohydrolase [Aquifex aeolicus VF5]
MLKLKFNEEGLIPVIAQDYRTGEVRMLAYANEEAIKKTLETGYAHYYSRSRKKIWKKGETSGELQKVIEVRVDCDEDALIYVIEQEKDRACHTGERNCFFRDIEGNKVEKPLPFEVLPRLQDVIREKIERKEENSYTAKLVSQGKERVFQKFGEEAVETLIALMKGEKEEVIYESADMLYTFLVSLSVSGIDIKEVMEELIRRFK